VLLEGFGGKVPFVLTSAVKKQGIDELLEMILLLSDLEDLKSNLESATSGFVLESFIDSKRGPSAVLIIQNGILKIGDIVATKSTWGKVKILENFEGIPQKELSVSQVAIVVGFKEAPLSGEEFLVFKDEKSAQEWIEDKKKLIDRKSVIAVKEGQEIFNLILKADVVGSLEALQYISESLNTDDVFLRIIATDIGDVSDEDVKVAIASKAIIFAFRVKTKMSAKKIAEANNIQIVNFEVIYEFVEKMREIIQKRKKEKEGFSEIGKLKVLGTFWDEKNKQIIGGNVIEGKIAKTATFEILRDGEIVGKGKIINLQQDKKNVDVVNEGRDAGIFCETSKKILVGDVLVFFGLPQDD